ncbi:hypothetical protein COT72_02980 [archaeon CG10_big_fil_rev_8_21_14_0_10_43_11]|nr:MAG: hypothetical protein COT72_02980 [archaeon CG10_big_fil_rev_8_21_14_0_10_43_11]
MSPSYVSPPWSAYMNQLHPGWFHKLFNATVMPCVSLDVEGVLADVHSVWINKFNKDFDMDISLENISHYDFSSIPKKYHPLKHFMDYTRDLWAKDWESIPLVEKQPHLALDKFVGEAHYPLDIVTARNSDVLVKEKVISWLKHNDLLEYCRNVHFTDAHKKALLFYDFYIDDNPFLQETLEPWQTQIVFKRPWNESFVETHQFISKKSLAGSFVHIMTYDAQARLSRLAFSR